MANCTVPKYLGFQSWFDAKFFDICVRHDAYYVIGCPFMKLYGDFWAAAAFTKRGYWWLGLLSLPYTLTLGSVFWIYHRICNLISGKLEHQVTGSILTIEKTN